MIDDKATTGNAKGSLRREKETGLEINTLKTKIIKNEGAERAIKTDEGETEILNKTVTWRKHWIEKYYRI